MEQAVEVGVSGIKCDAEECDFEDNTVTLDNYPEWINRECPKCGANLLTQADYDTVLEMLGLVDVLNVSFEGNLQDLGEEVNFKVKMKGDGSVELIEGDRNVQES